MKLTDDFSKDFTKNQLRRFFAAVLKNHPAPKQVSVRSALWVRVCSCVVSMTASFCCFFVSEADR